MKNKIGEIHDIRNLSDQQIEKAKNEIKEILHLDSIEISKKNSEFYTVTTDDETIIDFSLDRYAEDKISLVKYQTFNDEMQRDRYGAILTIAEIKLN